MHYFGLEGVDSVPTKNVFPPNFHQSSFEDKRKWLCEHVGHLFDQYVSDSVTDWGDSLEFEAVSEHQAVSREEFPCRFSGCSRVFLYAKCRRNHEKSKHGLVVDDVFEPDVIAETTPQDVLTDTVQPSPSESLALFAAPEKTPEGDMGTIVKEDMKKEDHIFNYGCLHISLGLLIRDAEDSVKEGDGERLIRVWKFLTYLFRLRGCHKYALAGLRKLASMEGLLTPRKAHQLKWNRFAGLKQGPGTRISRDERLEQLNKVSKEEIRSRGFPNINDNSVVTATRSTGAIDKLVRQSNHDLQRQTKSGHHCNRKGKDTFATILAQIHCKARVFQFCPGREYKAFPGLCRDLFKDLDLKTLANWLKNKKEQWHRQNRHLYKCP